MTNKIYNQFQFDDGTRRVINYTFTKEVAEELAERGIDVDAEIQQGIKSAIEDEQSSIDKAVSDKPQLIEDIRGGKTI